MKLKVYERLRKTMMLTTSENDAEALASIRSANKLLADAGIDWNRVFDRTISVVAEFEPAPDDEPKAAKATRTAEQREVDDAFEAIEAGDPKGSFADMIADIKNQWERTGSLSARQRRVVLDAAERRNR